MKYEKPPLVEVVIEVRFNTSIEQKKLENFARKVRTTFPRKFDHWEVDLSYSLHPDGKGQMLQKEKKGFRLETEITDYILIVTPERMSLSVLNPYPGWDDFSKKFSQYWTLFRGITKCRDISRVACLSVNRVDIPISGDTINIDEYLNIGIKTPSNLTLDGYQASMGIGLPDGIRANVMTATAMSPVPNHAALMLNIDVFNGDTPPQDDDGLFDLLKKFHAHKNDLFKDFVTEKSEALFVKVPQ